MKPSVPKGVRDFSPAEVRKRQYIFSKIQQVFERYGYQPIETPTMENLDTLTGKYGEEGDQLLFKVLNNGDYLSKADEQALNDRNSSALTSSISKRGLRYDLTVPFARYVVMNQHAISFPFKRFQIQPVWRADRPQKGRFQEFYQCDVDVVGSESLMYEAELVQIYDQGLSDLGVAADIHVSNRKILEGLAEGAGAQNQFMDMVICIDKLDKIGPEKVAIEMEKRGISKDSIEYLMPCLDITDLDTLESKIGHTESGSKGIEELRQFHRYLDSYTFRKCAVKFDITLARGLSYYTGCIFEVKARGVSMGSIGGGGRYDNLTGSFGLKDVSGVGVSFGAERIYLVMEELDLFPETVDKTLDLFIMAIDQESHFFAFDMVTKLRGFGLAIDLYPEPKNMKKMMKYANAIDAPYVLVIGDEERKSECFRIKNMKTGNQQQVDGIKGIISKFENYPVDK